MKDKKNFWTRLKEGLEKVNNAIKEALKDEGKKFLNFLENGSILEQMAVSFYLAATIGVLIKKIKAKFKKPAPPDPFINVKIPSSLVDKCFVHCLPKNEELFIRHMDNNPQFERANNPLNNAFDLAAQAGVKI